MSDIDQPVPPRLAAPQYPESLSYAEAVLLLREQLEAVTHALLQTQDMAQVEQFQKTFEGAILEQWDGYVREGQPYAALMLRALRET
jgi:hypothetical protein